MTYLAIASSVFSLLLLGYIAWQAHCFQHERAQRERSFAEERGIWIRERRDLNNRIQVPEAAPYLAEDDDPAAAQDDLPVLPEFTLDEEELVRAKHELETAGYDEGPAL